MVLLSIYCDHLSKCCKYKKTIFCRYDNTVPFSYTYDKYSTVVQLCSTIQLSVSLLLSAGHTRHNPVIDSSRWAHSGQECQYLPGDGSYYLERACTVCSISLIMLTLHFTLTIQGLFIDTDNRFKKRRVGQHVSEHVREKRNSLQIQPTIKTHISGVAGIRFFLEVMNNYKFSWGSKIVLLNCL